MAILLDRSTLYEERLEGQTTFGATAGQTVKIQTSPSGEEILEELVPAGKVWSVTVAVRILETDA